jgi:hypothetical protein
MVNVKTFTKNMHIFNEDKHQSIKKKTVVYQMDVPQLQLIQEKFNSFCTA